MLWLFLKTSQCLLSPVNANMMDMLTAWLSVSTENYAACSVYFWNHTAQGGLTDQAPCSVCGRNFNPDVLVSKQRLKSSNLIHPSVCSLVMNKLVRRSLKRGKFLTRQSRDIVAQNWSTFCPPTNRLLLSSPRRTREAGEKSTQSLYSLSEQQEMCL